MKRLSPMSGITYESLGNVHSVQMKPETSMGVVVNSRHLLGKAQKNTTKMSMRIVWSLKRMYVHRIFSTSRPHIYATPIRRRSISSHIVNPMNMRLSKRCVGCGEVLEDAARTTAYKVQTLVL